MALEFYQKMRLSIFYKNIFKGILFLKKKKNIFFYLPVLGLNCGMWDLNP